MSWRTTLIKFFLTREENNENIPPLNIIARKFGIDENLAACILCEFFCTTFLMVVFFKNLILFFSMVELVWLLPELQFHQILIMKYLLVGAYG